MQTQNNQIQVGSIVKSKSGHDSGSFYLVIDMKQSFAWIVDGRRRKLEKPKKKNILHLNKTNQIVNVTDFDTDKKIRRVLWDYNFGLSNSSPN